MADVIIEQSYSLNFLIKLNKKAHGKFTIVERGLKQKCNVA